MAYPPDTLAPPHGLNQEFLETLEDELDAKHDPEGHAVQTKKQEKPDMFGRHPGADHQLEHRVIYEISGKKHHRQNGCEGTPDPGIQPIRFAFQPTKHGNHEQKAEGDNKSGRLRP